MVYATMTTSVKSRPAGLPNLRVSGWKASKYVKHCSEFVSWSDHAPRTVLRLTHHKATPAKLMLLPQYIGSEMTLNGNPVTMWSMRMPK